MTDTVAWVLAIPVAYLIGAIPTGYLIGKIWRGVDVRRYGSGGTGFTNVMRTLGKTAAFTVLTIDVLKGIVPILLVRLTTDVEVIMALGGMMAIIGHMYPVFARFRGGRGVATGMGALIVLSPWGAAIAAAGVVIAIVTRVVSFGSLVGTVAGMGALFVFIAVGHHGIGYLAFAIPALLLIPFRHQANILRLARGNEQRLKMTATPRRKSAP